MKQFLIIFVLLSFQLSACNDSSIRKELYDDSLKYYNLLNERVMAIETYTEEDKKNLKAYDEKYTAMLQDLSKDERALSAYIISMDRSVEIISETYLILDKKDLKESVNEFVRVKMEAAKLLGADI
ncbi:hypothetical protein BRE01_48480 [Brevibacillus reuszeri]|uniref:Uncharacterized protein n=1 Tax=Brevibacillus reuszeri TaxID=54915 RepID=A0A0K9YYJ3_9BACL|nr:hypothetical protein [Brevibacillus reuszeri]KNB73793.1 hypothetical protein ADS79_07615 [Brevibacillus reuszeri]MED1860070.1 hypothetical protein [Brevibacillus reuszeri]GED71146.1 hypothetical protein BRE01_48480 [Brevibacillus reuszeri]